MLFSSREQLFYSVEKWVVVSPSVIQKLICTLLHQPASSLQPLTAVFFMSVTDNERVASGSSSI